jgi:hypothetical protein
MRAYRNTRYYTKSCIHSYGCPQSTNGAFPLLVQWRRWMPWLAFYFKPFSCVPVLIVFTRGNERVVRTWCENKENGRVSKREDYFQVLVFSKEGSKRKTYG